MASAKGQVPFHPVSMYLLSLYRRERSLPSHEVRRRVRHLEDSRTLRRCAGFEADFPCESGLRYFEGQLMPELQQETNALQLDALYQAGLLPIKADVDKKTRATLSFDGMLHQARSRLRCSSVKTGCYKPAPRPCPAKEKGKQGCECSDEEHAAICRHATSLDPQARFIVYTSDNKRAQTPEALPLAQDRKSPG